MNVLHNEENKKCAVTDLGYYMDGYLKTNIMEVPKFLKKGYDCVIIVTGHGKVRLGKSTIGMQICYFLAWLLNEENKKKGLVPKDNPVPFTNENIAYNPEELMEIANKFPDHSVICYDEGRAGLDSARAMENINKTCVDFFQECGQRGHVIIIVLPSFFKLTETIACERSLFLVDVYNDRKYNRGYFNFYNENKKDLLYHIGKKKYGILNKYSSVSPNFYGRFTDYFPVDKKIYDEKKLAALKKKKKVSLEVIFRKQRDILTYMAIEYSGIPVKELAKIIRSLSGVRFSSRFAYLTHKSIKDKLSRGEIGQNEELLGEFEEENDEM